MRRSWAGLFNKAVHRGQHIWFTSMFFDFFIRTLKFFFCFVFAAWLNYCLNRNNKKEKLWWQKNNIFRSSNVQKIFLNCHQDIVVDTTIVLFLVTSKTCKSERKKSLRPANLTLIETKRQKRIIFGFNICLFVYLSSLNIIFPLPWNEKYNKSQVNREWTKQDLFMDLWPFSVSITIYLSVFVP